MLLNLALKHFTEIGKHSEFRYIKGQEVSRAVNTQDSSSKDLQRSSYQVSVFENSCTFSVTNMRIAKNSLLAFAAASLMQSTALAGNDVCPPDTAEIGQACPYPKNGPHICGQEVKNNVVCALP